MLSVVRSERETLPSKRNGSVANALLTIKNPSSIINHQSSIIYHPSCIIYHLLSIMLLKVCVRSKASSRAKSH